MSATPEGEHRSPTTFVAAFRYFAPDEETDIGFRSLMEYAFQVAVNHVLERFPSIEVVDPPEEVPATEVMERDEV